MIYDPEVRRQTPLARLLQERIARDGSISVRDYMHICLYHPEHGYYRTRRAIGRGGDFVTAPEISQVFGELIGLWCAVVWQRMGEPSAIDLIELGPGHGTMMRDMLRATGRVTGFHSAITVRMLEASEYLTELQHEVLGGIDVPIKWHTDVESARLAADRPRILIANELLDCMPREQWVRRDHGWTMRRVGIDAHHRLTFVEGEGIAATTVETHPAASEIGRSEVAEGDVLEVSDTNWLSGTLNSAAPAAGLFIDYGHVAFSLGDTLQAVRNHQWEHPLASPGEADLTMQVDFGALVRDLQRRGDVAIDGPLAQGEWLGRLGAIERASHLMAANPSHAAEIEAGVSRLLSPGGMGSRFLALGLRARLPEPLPGFEHMDKAGKAS